MIIQPKAICLLVALARLQLVKEEIDSSCMTRTQHLKQIATWSAKTRSIGSKKPGPAAPTKSAIDGWLLASAYGSTMYAAKSLKIGQIGFTLIYRLNLNQSGNVSHRLVGAIHARRLANCSGRNGLTRKPSKCYCWTSNADIYPIQSNKRKSIKPISVTCSKW